MTTLKKYGRHAGTLSRHERLQVLVFFVVVVLVILYGMYLGAWSLRQEEGWLEDSLTSRSVRGNPENTGLFPGRFSRAFPLEFIDDHWSQF
jgi:hypothetical protein